MNEKTKMRRTYERTMFIEDLTKAEITLYVFNESKYTADINDEIEVKYTGVKAWSIIGLRVLLMQMELMKTMNI